MDIDYIVAEWPIIVSIGIFVILILGLAYGVIVTADLPVSPARKQSVKSPARPAPRQSEANK